MRVEELERRDCASAGWWVESPIRGPVRLLHLDPAEFASVGAGYPVYARGADATTTRQIADYLSPLRDVVRVTNLPPTEPRFLTVEFGVNLPASAGLAGVGDVARTPFPFVLVAYPGTSLTAAETAAHEVGHALGLEHDSDRLSLMYGGDLSAGARLVSFSPALSTLHPLGF